MTNADNGPVGVDPDALLGEIFRLLEPFNKSGVVLSEATDIAADLNIDSVAVMDLIMNIEDQYNISIPLNLLADVRTVGDLALTVRKTLGSG